MKKDNLNDSAPKKSWFKENWSTIALLGMFLLGLAIFLYPSVSDYWNSFHQSQVITTYSDAVSNLSNEDHKEEITKALDYNYRLAQRGIEWKDGSNLDDYYDVLDITHTGVMGYLKINKINVTCPIYHTVDENVLQTGIGHLENTSLPVGAKTYDSSLGKVTDSNDGSHCALSGHRGLPSARLLSDLDKLVEGDMFSLNVLGETYYYQVDQIRVVLPSDVQELNIVPGEDYCTLITCTPYGINTHRLLVRGKRINKPQGDVSIIEDASVISIEYVAPFIAAPILLIIVLIVVFSKPKKKGEKE